MFWTRARHIHGQPITNKKYETALTILREDAESTIFLGANVNAFATSLLDISPIKRATVVAVKPAIFLSLDSLAVELCLRYMRCKMHKGFWLCGSSNQQ